MHMPNDLSKLTQRKIDRLKKADANAPEPVCQADMDSRLALACLLGRFDAVAHWIARGADPQQRDDLTGFTPLMSAAMSGDLRCIELLLPLSDMSAVDASGNDAHAFAARAPNPHEALSCFFAYEMFLKEREAIESECSPPVEKKGRMSL